MIPFFRRNVNAKEKINKIYPTCHYATIFAYYINMRVDKKLIYGAIGMIVLLIGVGFAFMGGGENRSDSNTNSNSEVRKHRPLRDFRRSSSSAKMKQDRRKFAKSIKLESREKPKMFFLDDEEEKELTDLARKVLSSLQAALDAEDFEQIKQIFEMARSAPKGSLGKSVQGMPVALRKKMIEALGWFGAQGMPEIVEYLADADPDVYQMAVDQFELALSDISLGDRDRAAIVVMASQVLTDRDVLERIFMEISNMRPTVMVSAIEAICANGTSEAKELMPETITFATGEDNIETKEDLRDWLADNPDDPDADTFYGPAQTN